MRELRARLRQSGDRFSFCFLFSHGFTVGYPISRLRRFSPDKPQKRAAVPHKKQLAISNQQSAKPNSKPRTHKKGNRLQGTEKSQARNNRSLGIERRALVHSRARITARSFRMPRQAGHASG